MDEEKTRFQPVRYGKDKQRFDITKWYNPDHDWIYNPPEHERKRRDLAIEMFTTWAKTHRPDLIEHINEKSIGASSKRLEGRKRMYVVGLIYPLNSAIYTRTDFLVDITSGRVNTKYPEYSPDELVALRSYDNDERIQDMDENRLSRFVIEQVQLFPFLNPLTLLRYLIQARSRGS